ncbi:MAG TPA: ATP-binding protein [Polyangia bacterium]|nr:ATP-binding protein [Polyangia bacterium]
MGDGRPDFQRLFEASPEVLLVLLPDAPRFTMVAATEARFRATHTTRDTLGRGLFEVFPDNPNDAGATGTSNLRASLERVVATRAADTMAVQKYDIRDPDGSFQVKHWSPKNIPVLGPAGEVLYILHRVEDVSDLIHASEMGEALRGRTRDMEREVLARSQELAVSNAELRAANAKLGELDAAKTAFFNNVSHEFRTPLTLMLGPLEDSLADPHTPLPPSQRERVELAHANALRLLKLVNALLDFSRLEAGRLQPRFAPVDLSALTAELSGMFQSAMGKADLRLVIDCPPLSQPIFVDRDMWEKIVPNLVSNAFKFTLAGEIAVRVRERADAAVLEVSDTGVGIPASELPKIFERFHRVPSTIGRNFEGTGIGLSLVRELAELHGGRVSVESTPGKGSTFRVEIPKGSAHLPAASIARAPDTAPPGQTAAAHAAEASHWLGAKGALPPPTAPAPAGPRPMVLVVDDNADLRSYLAGLLSPRYDLAVATDGQAALEAIHARRPDLVVSDVMMPRLDGIGLVKALRDDPATVDLPVILLSARAGEEASVQGIDSGADDYLVKPFSARELLARVGTHLELARMRRALLNELERANRELDAFSYSVSHDLRAPLRAIDGFARALLREHAAALDEGGRHYLDRVVNGAGRMSALIDALLDLARISRAAVNKTDADLSTLAAEVAADLRAAQPDRAVAIDIEPGLTAPGDRRLLNVVLVNLLGNAWKFTARTPGARIMVARHPDEPHAFVVRDNGAGFNMAHASRLFAPFQRFHASDEFAGTGIGLATVQRVVTRHGGRIWAEAAPDRGAAFFFTLPP